MNKTLVLSKLALLFKWLGRQLLAAASVCWLCTNLLIALGFLFVLAVIRVFIPIKVVTERVDFCIERLYQWTVRVDSFWLKHVIGTQIIVNGEYNQHPSPIIISNHVSGFDVALLQEIISGRAPDHSPLLKFLIKKELVWLPIIGWVCVLLDFPRLNRSKQKEERKQDRNRVASATKYHGIKRRKHSGALLVFPEGTRFSQQKRQRQNSPYQHLLRPKSGGLKIIKNHSTANTPIIDITIDYGQSGTRNKVTLWSCLYGVPSSIRIYIEHFNLSEIDDIEDWLNYRWQLKDELLSREVHP